MFALLLLKVNDACKIKYNSAEIFLCPKSAKVGDSHELNCISNDVGRWLAAAVDY